MSRADSVADAVCRAFAAGNRLDLADGEVPAALLVQLLVGEHPQHAGRIPALRLSAATVHGRLALPGANVGALVELSGCIFDEPIDLYAADLAGWRLTECVLPGLRAANLRVRSELGLERCTITGPVELPDARLEGPLRMTGTTLQTPSGPALTGIRMVVSGVLDARDTRVRGELRLWGARVDGTIDLRGAELSCAGGDALESGGVQVGGNLHCDRGFTAEGRVVVAGAAVAGNA
ncbi:MAG TPA: hypothetical protein VHH34_21645, partial [Pseudonocardiaceae bacterium]|nr:hypothetical protein [Pseudonocardiaceae bacterium]